MIALWAVLCGGPGAVDMAEFAKAKEPFLRGFLRLATACPASIPSAKDRKAPSKALTGTMHI
jgi:hypothetical protein